MKILIKKYLFFLAFLFCICSHTQASIFIEPEFGFTAVSTHPTSKDPTVEVLGTSPSGTSYGGKAGVQFSFIQLGVEYLKNNLRGDDGSFKPTEMAALLGLRLGWFRLYGGYIFDSHFKDDGVNLKGTGLKAGLSFYLFENFAISAEYKKVTFNTFTYQGYRFDEDYDGYSIFVSVPINFL